MRDQAEPRSRLTALLLLLGVYFLLRLVFQQIVVLKAAFIYPSGLIVQWFYGAGEYFGQQWFYIVSNTQFVLGASCSGTTFFCLLLAYITLRIKTHRASVYWLALAYPITVVANSMRVLSSIYLHGFVGSLGAPGLSDSAHVIAGTVAFLCTFAAIAYHIEQPHLRMTPNAGTHR